MQTAAKVQFTELASALRKRLEIIGDREFYQKDAAGHLSALQAVSEKIEALSGGLPKPLDPNLAHYLQRRSYDKALAWVEEHV